jgi:hypothetical protein
MSDLLAGVGGTDLSSSISVAVAKKALDAAKAEGAAAAGLINAAAKVTESLTRRSVQAGPGSPGALLDTTA